MARVPSKKSIKNKPPVNPTPARDPTVAANIRAARRLRDRQASGEERIGLQIKSTGPRASCREPLDGMSDDVLTIRLADAFGTTSTEFIDAMMVNLMTYFDAPNDRRATREINGALAVLDGMKPDNEVEAMLLAQMVATNDAAMRCLAQISNGLTAETFGNLAVKMMRTFTGQAEALAKLRRKGEQVVRVVHVHPGAQAVVGDIHNHQKAQGGQSSQSEVQSHAAGNLSQSQALPSPNPIGEAVPVPGGRRPQKVQDARRN